MKMFIFLLIDKKGQSRIDGCELFSNYTFCKSVLPVLLYNSIMPYLIDGHNLIPKLGLDLSSLDDETTLIELLNEFSRISRRGHLEIYFDNAQPAGSEKRKIGLVSVHFVRKPMIADDAIRLRLKQLKNDAKNWSVVSSDHRVQSEAKAVGAKVISSDEFARTVTETLRAGPPSGPGTKKLLSARELDEWLTLFGEGHDDRTKL
jgi:predicted RNA-binding protein with PIN domain